MALGAIHDDLALVDTPDELLETADSVWAILEAHEVVDLSARLERYLVVLAEEIELAAAAAQRGETPLLRGPARGERTVRRERFTPLRQVRPRGSARQ